MGTIKKTLQEKTLKRKEARDKWRAKNKEKIDQQQKEYMEKHKEKFQKYFHQFYLDNKEKIKAYSNAHYEKNIEKITKQHKKYREENKDKIIEIGKKYRENNKEKCKEYCRKYENKESTKKYRKEYRRRPEVREASRKKEKEYDRKRRSNPLFRFNMNISRAIRLVLRKNNLSKNGRHWEHLVGYTCQDLRKHLEKLFKPGMSWDNYGKWHLDHVIPLSFFKFNSEEDVEFKMCWRLENLQPLWAEENMSKGDRIIEI